MRLGRHTALSAARTPLPAAAPLLPRPRSAGEQCQPRPDVSPPHRPGRAATHGREDAAPHGVARTRHGGREGRAVPGSRARLRSRARTETLRQCFLLDGDKRAIADLAPWRLTKTQRFEVLSPSTALEARRGCSVTPTRAPRLHPSSVRAGAARAAQPEPGENPVSLARG